MKARFVRLNHLALAIGILTSAALICSPPPMSHQAAAATQDVSLPSGSQIVIEGVGKIYFSKNEMWAMAMNYHTKTAFDDTQALRQEAIEVWREFFGRMSEESGLTAAMLAVFDKPEPKFIGTRQTRYFVFRKHADGQWNIGNPDELVAWK